MDADHYPAIEQLKPGRYVATVRDIFQGEIARCSHSHKSRSAAIKCSKTLDISVGRA